MVLNSFFSKQAILAKEDLLWEKVEQLCQALEKQNTQNKDQAVDLRMSLLAFATDFFTTYGIGGSPHPELLPDLGWQVTWVKVFNAIEDLTPVIKQLPWIIPIVSVLPMWPMKLLAPNLSRLYALRQVFHSIPNSLQEHADSNRRVCSKWPRQKFNALSSVIITRNSLSTHPTSIRQFCAPVFLPQRKASIAWMKKGSKYSLPAPIRYLVSPLSVSSTYWTIPTF